MGGSSSLRASPLPKNKTRYQNIPSRDPMNGRFVPTAAARASSTDSGTHRPDTPTLSLRTRVRDRRRRSCPQSGGRTGNEHRHAGRVNLAWKLALVCRGECAETLLNSFSIERSAIGDQVLKVAGRMTMVATMRIRRLKPLGTCSAESCLDWLRFVRSW